MAQQYTQEQREAQARHALYIKGLVTEMRHVLKKSEEARDTYYRRKKELREKGMSASEADIAASQSDYIAKCAISDSQLYDRWATKYAAVVQAELMAYEQDIHI